MHCFNTGTQVVQYFIDVIGMDTDSINVTQGKSRLRTAMDYALQPVDGQTDAIATGKYEVHTIQYLLVV
jgi:hypothetical protein